MTVATTIHSHDCVSCGMGWSSPEHRRILSKEVSNAWRGNPGLITPHRQWLRERMPVGRDGFVVCGDDGFARTWSSSNGPIGVVTPMEWKSYGKSLDGPTSLAFMAIERGQIRPAIVIRMLGGNVPTWPDHYPTTCECGLPEPPEIAERILVNGVEVAGDRLAEYLLELVGYEARP